MLGDPVRGRDLFTRARDLAVSAGRVEWTASLQNCLAFNAELVGDLPAALAYCHEGLSLFAGKDVATTAYATLLVYAASYMHRTGSPAGETLPLLEEAVEYLSKVRSPMLVATTMDRMAEIMAPSRPGAAARLLQASDSVKQKFGVARDTSADMQALRAEMVAHIGQLEPPADVSLDEAIETARAIAAELTRI